MGAARFRSVRATARCSGRSWTRRTRSASSRRRCAPRHKCGRSGPRCRCSGPLRVRHQLLRPRERRLRENGHGGVGGQLGADEEHTPPRAHPGGRNRRHLPRASGGGCGRARRSLCAGRGDSEPCAQRSGDRWAAGEPRRAAVVVGCGLINQH